MGTRWLRSLLVAVAVSAAAFGPVQGVAAGGVASSANTVGRSAPSVLPAPPSPIPTPLSHRPRTQPDSKRALSPKTLSGGGTWNWQNPLPDGNPLFAISCPSATTCYAVGLSGPILKTSNGGTTWNAQAPETFMNAISCASATSCVAVGDSGVVMYTSDGTNWTSPSPINGGSFLAGVSCPSTTVCFAVGYAGSVLITSNGGATWTAQSSGTLNNLFAITCPGTTTCYAVGASGTIAWTTDGLTWGLLSGGNDLFGISCVGSITCVAVGQAGTVLTTTNPTCCWSPGSIGLNVALTAVSCQPTSCLMAGVDGSVYFRKALTSGTHSEHGSTNEKGALFGISCPSTGTCFAVGDYETIVGTSNGGTGWSQQTSNTGNDLLAINCPSAAVCFAVGRGGTVDGTIDGGTTWAPQTSNTTSDLDSISCPSTSTCFAVGATGTVIATTNGGALWSAQTSSTNTLTLNAISCPSTTVCFAATNTRFLVTTNAGTLWSNGAPVGSATGLTAISCPSTTVCFATDVENPSTTDLVYKTTDGANWSLSFNLASDLQAGVITTFNAIDCPDALTCYAVGGISKGTIGSPPPSGLIAATTDGGANWRTDGSNSLAALTGVSCPSAGTCYVSADDSTILYSTDHGGTWAVQFGGYVSSLLSYTDVSCGSVTACFAVGWGGLVSATTTGGASWSTERPSGTTNRASGLSCFDLMNCYAAAQGSLLSTHDGGVTWSTHVLTSTDQLDGISCPAANTCFAVGWPGAIYMTGDGGTTWNYETSFLSGSDQTLSSVSCTSVSACVAVGTQGNIISTGDGVNWVAQTSGTTRFLTGVSCPSATTCVAVGLGGLSLSRSGGSWQSHASGTTHNLYGVSCPSLTVCYVVGDVGTVLFSSNTGGTWTAQSSGTTALLGGVSCLSTTMCLAVGNFGIAILTLDGSHWTALNTPTFNGLRAAAFVDLNHAWVAGFGGTVLANADLTLGCGSAGLISNKASPQPVGNVFVFTASSTGCPNPAYEFWLKDLSGNWTVKQGFSLLTTWTWDTTGLPTGVYVIVVWANQIGDSTAQAESSAVQTVTLIHGCTGVNVIATPPSPSGAGQAVTVTGAALGCPNPNPMYEFWVLAPGAGAYTLGQPYGTSPVFNWSTASLGAGNYRINVWVLDAGGPGAFVNSSGRWDAYNASLVYTLTPGCASVSDSASPTGQAMVGAAVTVSALASGCINPSPLFEFWVLAPGASLYTLAQPYSTSSTFNWSTTGLAPGIYRITVWVHDASSSGAFGNSSGRWDAYNAGLTYTLTAGCASVSDSASPLGPAMVGVPVTITAVSSGCLGPSPLYEFWVLAPGASLYTLAQPYGTSPTLNWITTGLAPGTYRINVWVHDASESGVYGNSSGRWDAYNAGLTYTLTAGCPSVSDSASPAAAAMSGMPVTITAVASGCLNPSPLYEFWILAPGASLYSLAQPYGTSPTLNWSTTGLATGTYRINVWVKDASSSGVFGNSSGRWDAYNAGLLYTLTAGCPSVSDSASPPSTAPAGTTVVVTASAPGCPNPLYEFWVLAPGAGLYTLGQTYGASPTFNWNTTGLAKGTYRITVWVHDASDIGINSNSSGRWDAYIATLTYILT